MWVGKSPVKFWRSKWSQNDLNQSYRAKDFYKIHQSQNIFLSNILMFAAFVKESIVSWIYMIVRQSWLVSCVDCLALGFSIFGSGRLSRKSCLPRPHYWRVWFSLLNILIDDRWWNMELKLCIINLVSRPALLAHIEFSLLKWIFLKIINGKGWNSS